MPLVSGKPASLRDHVIDLLSSLTCEQCSSILIYRLYSHTTNIFKIIPEGVVEEDKLEVTTKHGSLIA